MHEIPQSKCDPKDYLSMFSEAFKKELRTRLKNDG